MHNNSRIHVLRINMQRVAKNKLFSLQICMQNLMLSWSYQVSHDASARHSKRAPTHPRIARALWERTITPRHLRRRSYSPTYTITPRDSSPVIGRRVDAMYLHIDVAQ